MSLNKWSILSFFVIFLKFTNGQSGSGENDKVQNLPGLTFNASYNQYSGFLTTSTGSHLHYWLVEAQSDPLTKPLFLWLNGGPGSSSMAGLFQENGPYQTSPDGQTLTENVYSWNKFANVIYLESPFGVGFSYQDPPVNSTTAQHSDNLTRDDNAEALQQFVIKFPRYSGRPFYITGESYGGVYIPTLAVKVTQLVDAGQLNLNFVGIAIGNGILSSKNQVNSYIDLSYYRGIIGKTDIDRFKACCPNNTLTTLQYCDYAGYYLYWNETAGVFQPKNFNDPKEQQCAIMTYNIGEINMWINYFNHTEDVYNSIESCYEKSTAFAQTSKSQEKIEKLRFLLSKFTSSPVITDGIDRFVDQGAKINTKATDPWNGYYCYSDAAMTIYLNRPEVKTAIHVTPFATNLNWTSSSNLNYLEQYPETDDLFLSLLKWNGNLSILLYNGDTDSVCNFIGDQWFVERLSGLNSPTNRTNWHFSTYSNTIREIAGSQMRFPSSSSGAFIDLVTIKGSGHLVPTDRPGPAFQMIYNFISRTGNYDLTTNVSVDPLPLTSNYQAPQQTLLTRKEADKVYDLPGLTFSINFENYAGYLKGVKGNYLHYWLLTSQTNPTSDPLFLWLTGGPGCSSLGALLTELGPFRPNYDNKTLSENVYSWNKAANILFLESPRGVGFSFQDPTENNDTIWNDDRSAKDAYLALADFLTVYPEYVGREFYVVGESYGGIYVPMLTSLLVEKIQSGELKGLNLVGMAVGNGELSAVLNSNSLLSDMYYHGYIGKGEWDQLAQCCNTSYQELPLCPFDQRYYLDSEGGANPVDPNDPCDVLVADFVNNVWTDDMLEASDVYDAYQDCYQQTQWIIGSVRSTPVRKRVVQYFHKVKRQQGAQVVSAYRYQNDNYNPISTDNLGGFPCYGTDAAGDYLNRPEVRRALHVPSDNPYINKNWQFCNDTVNGAYIRQYNDTGIFFDKMFASGYPLKILIYNGDTDFACNFVGDQWFVENLASKWGLQVTQQYSEWLHRNQIAGYSKKFQGGVITLNLLTVKGAGHMVPMNRPGPALQMILNFFSNRNWNSSLIFISDNTPLKLHYQTLEYLANASYTAKQTSAYRKAIGQYADLVRERTKREIKADPPPPTTGNRDHDKITALPGQTFNLNPNQNQYSGYLQANPGVYLHYWLIESAFDKDNAPIILWLNGGPGCSSLGGLLNELGPFRPSSDGTKLYENVYSWTKVGNLLFLESPRGVGFSYSSGSDVPSNAPYNDTLTAQNNVQALISFFNMFTEFQNRPFYITGESYAGVYIPTLTDALIDTLQKNTNLKINFVGIAIGNGELSEVLQVSSAINLLYFRGTYDLETFKKISKCCPDTVPSNVGYLAPCDFTQYITLDQYGNAHGITSTTNSTITECGQLVETYGFDNVWGTLNDVYNTYQDCYNPPYADTGLANRQNLRHRRAKRSVENDVALPGQVLSNAYPFVDEAKLLTKDSTDAFKGVYCYQDDATAKYLNTPAVQQALHVDGAGITWQDCNDDMNAHYIQQHNDTNAVFESILSRDWPLKILIYNGDVDMACQFKGDEWFIERLVYNHSAMPGQRGPWFYKFVDDSGIDNDKRIAGFQKHFTFSKNVSLDQLTVKGAGHFVPLDRPAPGLQMLYNFINNNTNYSVPLPANLVKPADLLATYQPSPIPVQNKHLKKVSLVRDLPGLTFDPQFSHHSGYLNGSVAGNYYHYWFAESQNDPSNDPIVFWFSGDIGCSSVASMLSEMGPFKPNPDGLTLFENIYSWNKYASMVFIEIPHGVGFSYIDQKQNPIVVLNDDATADDAAAVIKNWLKLFDNFASNTIYIGGETYAGVIVPLIAQRIATGISDNDATLTGLKFQGILIGNGHLSKKWDLMHMGDFMYFHAQVSKEYWDNLRACCAPGIIYCDVSQYIKADGTLDTSSNCGKLIDQMSEERIYKSALDVYNIYQDCYGYTNKSFGKSLAEQEAERQFHIDENAKFKHDNRPATLAAYVSQFTRMNFKSTDSTGGFQCYMVDAIQKYLSQSFVRDALNIPDYVQQFDFCNSTINYIYNATYNVNYKTDMSDTFKSLMNNPYMKKLSNTTPFKILIYNGDVSLKATTMEAEYFVETLATDLNVNGSTRSAWNYQQPTQAGTPKIGGYRKLFQFKTQNVVLELTTVKGAGTFVAVDRPGPALQMFANFIANSSSVEIGQPIQFSMKRQPLKPEFEPPLTTPAIVPPNTVTTTPVIPSSSSSGLPTTTTVPLTGPTVPTTTTTPGPSQPPPSTSSSGPTTTSITNGPITNGTGSTPSVATITTTLATQPTVPTTVATQPTVPTTQSSSPTSSGTSPITTVTASIPTTTTTKAGAMSDKVLSITSICSLILTFMILLPNF